MAPLLQRAVARMARLFVVEEDARVVAATLTKIAGLPEAEADRYAARIHTLLAWLEAGATQQPDLSVKLSALTPRFDPIDLDCSVERVLVRLEPIRTAAAQAGSEDTLRQFVWSRVVSSNQLRHGYVPDLGGQIS
jgi:RHH-type proline utilization regulon transcriptional repressor/proline dehydrogenase/delta 1-pyrroline-5-carboxylate dehydrogenase